MKTEDIIKVLKNHECDIHELNEKLNLSDTKEFIALQKELNNLEDNQVVFMDDNFKYHLIDNKRYRIARAVIKRNGRAFVDDDNLGLIDAYNIKDMMQNDIVLYEFKNSLARIIKVLSHSTTYIVGLVRIRRNKVVFYADDIRLKDFTLEFNKAFKLKDRMKVRAIITNYEKKICRLETIIGYLDDPNIRELSVLYANNAPVDFSNTTINETKIFKKDVLVQDYPGRKDETDEFVITIDGDSAKDFDDAISLTKNEDGYVLKVHIADVSEYVKENSSLDKEARERGTSIYYANKVIPMLPVALSNGLCSLNPNVNRLAMTACMHLDLNGDVVSSEFYESIIKSKYRMTYNKANMILDGEDIKEASDLKLKELIFNMEELSLKLRKKREDNGSIDFKEDESELIFEGNKLVDIRLRKRGESEKIIEDFMILANVEVASYMKYLDYPMIYRNHDYPKEDRLELFIRRMEDIGYHFKGNKYDLKPMQLRECLKHFENTEMEAVVSSLLLRSMSKALYDNTCIGHYGLGLDNYCHFTSPIRRYPDLMVHRALKKYVFSSKNYDDINKDTKKYQEIAKLSNDREKRATLIERDILDLKKCEFMKDKIGKVYDGIISSVMSFGFFVRLDNTVEGLVGISSLGDYYEIDEQKQCLSNNFKSFSLGDKVRVKVKYVDMFKSTIDFSIMNKRKY